MVEKQDVLPAMQLVKVCDESENAIEEHDVVLPGSEGDWTTTEEIMGMLKLDLKWRCRIASCDYGFPLKLDQLEATPFFIVRHLIRDHGLRPIEVIDLEPTLASEVADYIDVMGVETPVTNRTGVSAKMEAPR